VHLRRRATRSAAGSDGHLVGDGRASREADGGGRMKPLGLLAMLALLEVGCEISAAETQTAPLETSTDTDGEPTADPDGRTMWYRGSRYGFSDDLAPTEESSMCTPAATVPPRHHLLNCLGECGIGCNSIFGTHYCTSECLLHDLCTRCIGFGDPRCMAVFGPAIQSWFECLVGLRGCDCPGPHALPIPSAPTQ